MGAPALGSVLIEGGTVVTMDRGRRTLEDASVLVEDGKVAAVGRRDSVGGKRAEERIDARGMAVIPGLVDTHLHLAQSLIRGYADDLSLIGWLRERVWPMQGNFTKEDGRASARLSLLEMMKSGTTSFVGVDVVSRYGFEGIAEEVSASGMRGALAKSIMDSGSYGGERRIMHPGLIEERAESLAEAKSMAGRWNGVRDGRVKIWLAPRSLGGCSRGLYEEVAELAVGLKTGVTMHLAEVKEDVRYAKEAFGMTPVEFAEAVGLAGPHVLFAHMVWADDREIGRLAATKTNVAHNPSSNLKLASGVPRVPEMLEAGVNVGLGCDGAPCNNSYDMVREMKLAAVIQKARLRDPTAMPAQRVLEMATIGGARAMGMEKDVGSIEVGKRADLVLVDLRKPHLTPHPNVVSSIVYSAMGSDVDTVMVEGKVIVKGGSSLTLDEAAVVREASERAAGLAERSGIRAGD
ncbi:MAG: amidohydrolase [Nitrososphaerota archaeon]|nr:amidohydrolase [Nitrososphaerota archaeon]